MKRKISFSVLVLMVILVSIFFYLKNKKDDETIKIVAVATMRGISAGVETINGMKIALKDRGYKVDGHQIELEVMDNGDEDGLWRENLEKEIAQKVASDKNVLVYLGPIDSGAAKISIPITNKAGLSQISSINTWPGLTQPGFAIGEPGIFYPTGVRNYFRVCPTDSLQGVYGAIWASEIGFKNIFIFDDNESYGKGISSIFEKKAIELGLNVIDHKSFNREGNEFPLELNEIKEKKPDLVYFGGTTSIGLVSLINSISDLGLNIKFMGADGIMDQALIEKIGDNSEGLLLTAIGLPIEEVKNEKATNFSNSYFEEYSQNPTIYSGFGYEAMSVALTAIDQADSKDRKNILRELTYLNNFVGLFGEWGFDNNGDTSLTLVSANIVKNGEFIFEKILK